MARAQMSDAQKRHNRSIKFSEDEWKEIREAAKLVGCASLSRFIREAALKRADGVRRSEQELSSMDTLQA